MSPNLDIPEVASSGANPNSAISVPLVSSTSIIEPPEGDERADDELVSGDAFGAGVSMRLLASGVVERPIMRMLRGQSVQVGTERHRALDVVEMTQILSRVLRRLARSTQDRQTLRDEVQSLRQRVTALEQR
jgi:hypothetical protein